VVEKDSGATGTGKKAEKIVELDDEPQQQPQPQAKDKIDPFKVISEATAKGSKTDNANNKKLKKGGGEALPSPEPKEVIYEDSKSKETTAPGVFYGSVKEKEGKLPSVPAAAAGVAAGSPSKQTVRSFLFFFFFIPRKAFVSLLLACNRLKRLSLNLLTPPVLNEPNWLHHM